MPAWVVVDSRAMSRGRGAPIKALARRDRAAGSGPAAPFCRRQRQTWPFWRAALVVALTVAGLSPSAAFGQPAGELRVALPWTPENLDPTMNLASIRAAVGVSLFDSLVGRDADNRIVSQLAESWKLVDDLTWQFKLRRGVVFHNGEPFTAEAVRATVERVLDPNQKSPNRANLAEIVRVEVLDEATINIVTQKPYAPLLNRLVDFAILPPTYPAAT